MKFPSRLDEWSLKYLEHGMDGKKKNTTQRTLFATKTVQ